jgi:hypothetical protein
MNLIVEVYNATEERHMRLMTLGTILAVCLSVTY